jgi:hypothetical protein
MCVPYDAREYAGGRNQAYEDLKKDPERIEAIPELASLPALRGFVRTMNARDSAFRTLGCHVMKAQQIPDGFKAGIWCYVDIAFEALSWNDTPYSWDDLFRKLSELDDGAAETEIRARQQITCFFDHDRHQGFTASLEFQGNGLTHGQAVENISRGLSAVQQLLNDFFKDPMRLLERETLISDWRDCG